MRKLDKTTIAYTCYNIKKYFKTSDTKYLFASRDARDYFDEKDGSHSLLPLVTDIASLREDITLAQVCECLEILGYEVTDE